MMRRKILIVNFGVYKDIVSSGALVSEIVNGNGMNTVYLLVLKEYCSSALILDNVAEIATIDRASLRSLFNNKIYPNHYSLNLFWDKVSWVENHSFDLIVNYSGDKAASYLTGYFSSKTEICGPYYSYKNNLCHTSEWSIVGEIAQEMDYISFERSDIYGKMMGLKQVESKGGYVVRERHEKTVEHSLNKLRYLNRYQDEHPKIVGVHIGPASDDSLPLKIVMDLLREIRRDRSLLPLVIAGTSEEDENMANFINERFSHSLTLVKMDIVAAPSLMKGIDALVCAGAYCRDLAELVETKVVEVSLGGASLRGRGVVVTSVLSRGRIESANERTLVKSSDIIHALRYVLDDKKIRKMELSSGVSAYRLDDGYEFFYEKIDEGKEGKTSIDRVMARNVIMLRFSSSGDFNKKFDYLLLQNTREDLDRWVKSERKMVAETMKNMLSVIRLVLQSRKERGKIRDLAYKFDNLLSCEEINGPVKIPIIFLRGGVFSMEKVDFVLDELYKAKNHLQKYSVLIDELDSYQRKGRFKMRQLKIPEIRSG